MNSFFLIMGFGPAEMIMIAVVGLLLFGRRLPEVGRSVGKSFYEFKRGLGDIQGEMREVEDLKREVSRAPEPRPVADRPMDAEKGRDEEAADQARQDD